MNFFKNRDRPKAVKQKLIVVATALLCILSIGACLSLSSFMTLSDSSGDFNGSVLNPPGDNNSGNTGGDADVPESVLDTQAVQITSLLEFENSYSWEAGDVTKLYKGADLTSEMNYGKIKVSDGYLNFSSRAEDVGKTAGTKFSLFFDEQRILNNAKVFSREDFDIMVIDFDIWSDTGVLPDIYFKFKSSADSNIEDKAVIALKELGPSKFFCLNFLSGTNVGSNLDSTQVKDITKTSHLSILIVNNFIFLSYYDGEYISLSSLSHFPSLSHLSVEILEHEIKENESLCIDNFCVSTYGNGSGEYWGDLVSLWNKAEGSGFSDFSIYDCTDWVLYEKYLTPERVVNNIKNKEMYVPSSGTELNKLDFSGIKSSDYMTLREQNGLRLDTGYVDVLDVSTLDDYLKLNSTKSTDSGFSVGFYMLDEACTTNSTYDESKLNLSSYDYITIDFDVWTDSSFFESMEFKFVGRDSSDGHIQASYPELFLTGKSWDATYVPYSNPQIPMHLTFIITENSDSAYRVSMYINGNHFKTVDYALQGFEKLYYLTLWFSKGSINAGHSVCFDNVQVMGFGNGDGSYSGSISELVDANGNPMNLYFVEDSVVYKKYNQLRK